MYSPRYRTPSCVPFAGTQPEHEWYTEPIGAERWDALVAAARVADPPFAERFAARRDALVALDALVVPPGPTRRLLQPVS
jgi:hypothetical protein